jgi:hypothetical protein
MRLGHNGRKTASTRATRPELASATASARLSGTLVASLGLTHTYLQKRFLSLLYDLGPRLRRSTQCATSMGDERGGDLSEFLSSLGAGGYEKRLQNEALSQRPSTVQLGEPPEGPRRALGEQQHRVYATPIIFFQGPPLFFLWANLGTV